MEVGNGNGLLNHNENRYTDLNRNEVDKISANETKNLIKGEPRCQLVDIDTKDNENEKSKIGREKNGSKTDCGCFGWTPRMLQKAATPQMLLACLCWFLFVQGFVLKGIIYVNLATWERLYGLNSRQASWIVSSYDVSSAVFNLVFGYLGQFWHNGRILTVAALCNGAGSLVMMSVHFLSEPYQLGELATDLCSIADNDTLCSLDDSSTSHAYFWIFLVAQCLHGVAGGSLFCIAVPYLDTQISPQNTPLYIGIMQAFAALGPAAGYICGGLLLNIYVDYGRVNISSEDLDPSDPRWVGAWWIGLIFSTFASFTVAILLAGFPKELRTAKQHKRERNLESHRAILTPALHKQGVLRQFTHDLKLIWMNPVWLCIMLLGITEQGVTIGFAAFIPKLIQHQFGKTSVSAAIIAGAVIIPGAVGGKLIGGFIPKLLKSKMRGLLMQSIITTGLGLLLSMVFLIRCPPTAMVGINHPYTLRNTSEVVNLQHSCNTHCDCTAHNYEPVCGSNGQQYFSPCFAGCRQLNSTQVQKTYYDCTCLEEYKPEIGVQSATAVSGLCETDCQQMYLFLSIFLCLLLFTFISDTSSQGATVRSLSERHRSLALGIQAAFHCILGHASHLYLLGFIFDNACLQWQSTCDGYGACWIYDSDYLAKGLFIVCIVVKAISLSYYVCALVLYKPPASKDNDITIVHMVEAE